MSNYNLQALLTIREHHKRTADNHLKKAISTHQDEVKKLEDITTKIKDSIGARALRHNNFFTNACNTPSGKTHVMCHNLANAKTLRNELLLKSELANQQEIVKKAQADVDTAKYAALDAHRHLKVIEKHFEKWQRRIEHAEEIKAEYQSDEQNGIRYLLKKV